MKLIDNSAAAVVDGEGWPVVGVVAMESRTVPMENGEPEFAVG